MTKKLLEKLFTRFYRKHIMRPKILIDYITMIWRSPDSWKRFITNIGPFLRFALTDRRISEKKKAVQCFRVCEPFKVGNELSFLKTKETKETDKPASIDPNHL